MKGAPLHPPPSRTKRPAGCGGENDHAQVSSVEIGLNSHSVSIIGYTAMRQKTERVNHSPVDITGYTIMQQTEWFKKKNPSVGRTGYTVMQQTEWVKQSFSGQNWLNSHTEDRMG